MFLWRLRGDDQKGSRPADKQFRCNQIQYSPLSSRKGAVGHDETVVDEPIIFGGAGSSGLQQRDRTDTGQHQQH